MTYLAIATPWSDGSGRGERGRLPIHSQSCASAASALKLRMQVEPDAAQGLAKPHCVPFSPVGVHYSLLGVPRAFAVASDPRKYRSNEKGGGVMSAVVTLRGAVEPPSVSFSG